MLPQNLQLIRSIAFKKIMPFVLFCAVAIFGLGYPKVAYSIVLGSFFSFLILSQLMSSQAAILQQRSKGVFFIWYICRLGLYAFPLSLGLMLKDYLNLWVILVSLFVFQIFILIFELMRNTKHFKRRLKNGTIR